MGEITSVFFKSKLNKKTLLFILLIKVLWFGYVYYATQIIHKHEYTAIFILLLFIYYLLDYTHKSISIEGNCFIYSRYFGLSKKMVYLDEIESFDEYTERGKFLNNELTLKYKNNNSVYFHSGNFSNYNELREILIAYIK